jgi:hypothetical protein
VSWQTRGVEQSAAWAVYVALHNLAHAHTGGEVPTVQTADGVMLGDLDDAREQLAEHGPQLDPGLARRVAAVLERWESDPTGRLVALLPVLDELEGICGAKLPPPTPPAP